jgi:Predicted transcriptional regulator containing an HTH domain and an uncharacterized domain shared with the mammalian protein Schlafen
MDFPKEENETTELKKSTNEKREAMESICSILNKWGEGDLFFGITPKGDVVGQQVSEKTLRELSQLVETSIRPQIFPIIKKYDLENGLAVAHIHFKGAEQPYANEGRYYKRVADEDKLMGPRELAEYFRANDYTGMWESTITNETMNDVDEDALKRFYDEATSCGRLDLDGFDKESLLNYLSLAEEGRLNNAGRILFSKNKPLTLKTAVYANDDMITTLDTQRYQDNAYSLIKKSQDYIKEKMMWRIEMSSDAKRTDVPEIPLLALREAVINGFAHADYGAPSEHEIDITPTKIELYNPGGFPVSYKPEDFISRTLHPMPRNARIVDVLYRCKDVESLGRGFKKIDASCKKAGVVFSYQMEPDGFTLIFHRSNNLPNNVYENVHGQTKTILNLTESQVLALLESNPAMNLDKIAEAIKKTKKTAQRAIEGLKKKGKIQRVGSDKSGYWEILYK